MVYKVEVVKKDEISEIRYIGSGNTSNIGKIIELDEFRDVANSIMQSNPKITYDKAFGMARDLKYKTNDEQSINNESVNKNFEKAKIKVLAINKDAS